VGYWVKFSYIPNINAASIATTLIDSLFLWDLNVLNPCELLNLLIQLLEKVVGSTMFNISTSCFPIFYIRLVVIVVMLGNANASFS
jgi:hypothetical protein